MLNRLQEVIKSVETFDKMTPEEKDAIMKGIRACDVIGVVGMACQWFSTQPQRGDSDSWMFIHRMLMIVAEMTERVEKGEVLPEAHILQEMIEMAKQDIMARIVSSDKSNTTNH
jgi:hypothetical protein